MDSHSDEVMFAVMLPAPLEPALPRRKVEEGWVDAPLGTAGL